MPAQANGRAPSPQPARLHVSSLTRNVTGEHIHEIFSTFGKVKSADLAMDRTVNLPRGFAYVEFEDRAEAEQAKAHMDGGQIDGNTIRSAVVLPAAELAACLACLVRHHCSKWLRYCCGATGLVSMLLYSA